MSRTDRMSPLAFPLKSPLDTIVLLKNNNKINIPLSDSINRLYNFYITIEKYYAWVPNNNNNNERQNIH